MSYLGGWSWRSKHIAALHSRPSVVSWVVLIDTLADATGHDMPVWILQKPPTRQSVLHLVLVPASTHEHALGFPASPVGAVGP